MANLPKPQIGIPLTNSDTGLMTSPWGTWFLQLFDRVGGDSGSTGTFAPADSQYIVKIADAALINAQVLGSLSSGFVKVTNTTGQLSSTGNTSLQTTDYGNATITYGKIQNVSATDKVLGRSTAGAGSVEEIPCTSSGRALIAGASTSAQRTTLGLGSLATQSTISNLDFGATAPAHCILGNLTGLTFTPDWNTLSSFIDQTMTATNQQGAILYRDTNANGWKGLGPGTSGQFLKTQGTAANPVWDTPSAGSGTVTSIATNNGITGGTITTTGTIGLASVSNNTILANVSGGSAAPSASTLTSANVAAIVTDETGSGALVFAASPTFTGTPVLATPTATSLTFSSTSGIIGTTTNNSAAAGSVGEVISSTILIASGVALTSGATSNITSISLTAGHWEVCGQVWLVPNTGTVVTRYIGAIGQTSATPATDNDISQSYFDESVSFPASAQQVRQLTPCVIKLASTTTVYLMCYSVFSISTCKASGWIKAMRIR